MRIEVIGGGPAGLYFAILMKKAQPGAQITVHERNRADDTFGFGVVFSDQTLETFEKYDRESYRAITENFAYWDDIAIHYKDASFRVGGNGFCGCSRRTLLLLLQERARQPGGVQAVHDLDRPGGGEAGAEAVGIGAVRYNIAKIQPEKGIQFRWEEALSFDGDSAPYLQYAYARATRLLEGCKDLELAGVERATPGASEAQLLSLAARLVHEAKDAADRIAPQSFCGYTMELATAFTAYYRDHPILDCPDAAVQKLRFETVQAWRHAMARAMNGLGIPILERM